MLYTAGGIKTCGAVASHLPLRSTLHYQHNVTHVMKVAPTSYNIKKDQPSWKVKLEILVFSAFAYPERLTAVSASETVFVNKHGLDLHTLRQIHNLKTFSDPQVVSLQQETLNTFQSLVSMHCSVTVAYSRLKMQQ